MISNDLSMDNAIRQMSELRKESSVLQAIRYPNYLLSNCASWTNLVRIKRICKKHYHIGYEPLISGIDK